MRTERRLVSLGLLLMLLKGIKPLEVLEQFSNPVYLISIIFLA